MLTARKIRDQKGAAVTGLVIALMFFVLIAGLFAFDANRVQMAQRELTATCDAAALAGTAMLTSYDVSNDVSPPYQKLLDAQQNSAAYAYNMFLMGNVLGRWIRGNCALVSDINSLATNVDGESKCCIGLVNRQNNFSIVQATRPQNKDGTAIGVFAGYGYHPVFISFFGVGNVGIRASSIGGLPQVDAILVLDYSGSMDDRTIVTVIKRYWDFHHGIDPLQSPTPSVLVDRDIGSNGSLVTPGFTGTGAQNTGAGGSLRWVSDDPAWLRQRINNKYGISLGSPQEVMNKWPELSGRGCVTYMETPANNISARLFEYVGLDYNNNITGTSLNALPPQNLDFAALGTLLTGNNVKHFKAMLRTPPNMNDYNSPPGNCALWCGDSNDPSSFNPMIGNNTGMWNPLGGSLTDPNRGRSNYNDIATNHLRHPETGDYNTYDHANLFTDMVVNFGNGNGGNQPPQQPAEGPVPFAPVTFTFNSSFEDDATLSAGGTYNFPNIAVVVEASRGNLDQNSNLRLTTLRARGFDLRAGDTTIRRYYTPAEANTMFVPKAGYQKAYQRLAMWYSQPIATCLDSADQAFFQRLSALTDCRFGLVGFSNNFGLNNNKQSQSHGRTGVYTDNTVGTATFRGNNCAYASLEYKHHVSSIPTWTQTGGVAVANGPHFWEGRNPGPSADRWECGINQNNATGSGFRIPRSPLSTAITQQQSLHCMQHGSTTVGTIYAWSDPNDGDGIYNGRPLDGTFCAEALDTARGEFAAPPYVSTQRPGSKRAIVFFTDGVPIGFSTGAEADASRAVAAQCKTAGIAMFCIGLNMNGNAQLRTEQADFLGNGSNGLAGLAKNGGIYFECSNVAEVKQAFAAIARRLTQSQK